MTTAFTNAGLRWAFQALRARQEVAGVMEEMLDTVEHWKLVNDMETYRLQLQDAHKEVARLQAHVTYLESTKTQQAAEAQALKATAKEIRDKFVANLIEVSKELRQKGQLEGKNQELAKIVSDKVPALEKELQEAKTELEEAKARLTAAVADAAAAAKGNEKAANKSMNGVPLSTSSAPSPSQPSAAAAATSNPPPQQPPRQTQHSLFTTITTLEEPLLLRVFSFLNAPDVLATAEVCKPFYDRIGVIFGHGNKHQDEDEEEQEVISATSSSTKVPTAAAPVSSTSTSSSSNSRASPILTTPSSFFKSYSNLLRGTTTATTTTTTTTTDLLSSFLPPLPVPSTPDGGLTPTPTHTQTSSSLPITEKLAASMASKLSGPELKSIISMTERVKKMEGVVLHFQAEAHEARARLQEAEETKTLLLTRLKESEVEVKKAKDGATGAARQRSSDQEVIAFLDGRVQDLEEGLRQTAERLAEVQELARRDRAQSGEQLRVLKEMLTFERSKAEENEAQFKQQKKILAKEIKSLRAERERRERENMSMNMLGGGGGGGNGGGGFSVQHPGGGFIRR